jgi:hypothetical protein
LALERPAQPWFQASANSAYRGLTFTRARCLSRGRSSLRLRLLAFFGPTGLLRLALRLLLTSLLSLACRLRFAASLDRFSSLSGGLQLPGEAIH